MLNSPIGALLAGVAVLMRRKAAPRPATVSKSAPQPGLKQFAQAAAHRQAYRNLKRAIGARQARRDPAWGRKSYKLKAARKAQATTGVA